MKPLFDEATYVRPDVADRLEIEDVVGAVSLFADLGDYDSAAKMFTPDATFDYSGIMGPEAANIGLKQYWDDVKAFVPGFETTHHQASNFDVRVDGDKATCTSMVRAFLRIGDKSFENGGVYHHRFVRTPKGWRITWLTYELRFEKGDKSLFDLARQRVAGKQAA